MAVSRPSTAESGAAAQHYGFHLNAEQRSALMRVVDTRLTSYDVVDEL